MNNPLRYTDPSGYDLEQVNDYHLSNTVVQTQLNHQMVQNLLTINPSVNVINDAMANNAALKISTAEPSSYAQAVVPSGKSGGVQKVGSSFAEGETYSGYDSLANNFVAGVVDSFTFGHGDSVYGFLGADWENVNIDSWAFNVGEGVSYIAGGLGVLRISYNITFKTLSKVSLSHTSILKASMFRYWEKKSPLGLAFWSKKEAARLQRHHPMALLYKKGFPGLHTSLGKTRGSANLLMLGAPGIGAGFNEK